ncbi:MFS transporter [Mycolicibacterium fluoranthenivorans]|jgi:MFS family permease|uniref:Predicted arabinose efflux permease, MFS family n=1 Tax=Mycolicibacterium fluoranthenivorans TaxID=258505 RepID=A0A1G4WYQ4_9MYCO|nr:MFS transporter [Mycolicibacterium fluoranthenivorans]SCX32478.1 Predicted arabinose efflux permease, MFS family [Mycolicibacterium fluoranthenivorans]
MATSSAAATRSVGAPRRAAIASLVGTTIEWFDFFIYGLAAALVFGDLFFASVDEHSGRLAAFATLGVAFVARPVGAVIFGHLGDRLGRKSTLIATLGIMGSATGLIGLLPTYETAGVWAPVLLVVLRLLQGLAVGGEWGGAVLMSVEHAPASKVRLYGSAPQMGSPLGLVLATAVMSAVATLPEDQLFTWGWRVPFLAGFILVLVGLAIRLGVEESTQFKEIKSAGATSRLPVREVFAKAKKSLTLCISLQASVNVVFYVISVYFLTYATNSLGLERSTALLIVMIAAVIDLAALPLLAALSDRLGAHRVFLTGALFTSIAAIPFFWLLRGDDVVLTCIVVIVMMIGAHATTYSVVSSLIAEQFDTKVRYSGTALSNALGGLIFSAPTPFIAEALVGKSGTGWWPLAVMTLAAALISLVAILLTPHRSRIEVDVTPSRSPAPTASA